MGLKSLEQVMRQRFEESCTGKLERDALNGTILFAKYFGVAEEVERYLEEHAEATVLDVCDYTSRICPENIEEVDEED